MSFVFLHCRAGFEAECAAEIQEQAASIDINGFCRAKTNAAYLTFHPQQPEDAWRIVNELSFRQLIFPRQWFYGIALLNNLTPDDRVAPICDALTGLPAPAQELIIESLDTNDGKALSKLCRSIESPMHQELVRRGFLQEKRNSNVRMHVCFLSTVAAAIGLVPIDNSVPWPMGIPRLKMPKAAPSRSTLKLDEALHVLLDDKQQQKLLRGGMTAIDLGAAPGGWTWQLVQRNMHVIAVDNGPMMPELLETGQVKHRREDGFSFVPAEPVDWMVCDIIDSPKKVASRMATWLSNGWCRYTIFNLKLPMKKRYQEVQECLQLIDEQLQAKGIEFICNAKQLYHDREEITVFYQILK